MGELREPQTNNQITYLLNTKSKRVHSKDCGVGRRSKDKNKQYRTDSLTNIVKDGYKICGDCNAGIKKSFISSIASKFDNPINVDYDDIVLPTREEYLNAIYNYKNNYSKIDAKSGILQYPCEFLSESIEYNKAGDDCVRYVFTVLNSIDPQFVERIAKSSRKMWSQINTRLIYSDKNHFVEAMFKNGFNIFDSKELILEKKIDKIDNNFKLEKGDIICRDGHIHIYVGNDGNDNFGWGKVNRKYPAKYNFSVERIGSEYRIKMDKGNDIEYYERVYRYRGGK